VVDRKMASPFHSVRVNLKAMLNLLVCHFLYFDIELDGLQ
jgi:hypothetical protein